MPGQDGWIEKDQAWRWKLHHMDYTLKEDAVMAQAVIDVRPLDEPLNLDKNKVVETLREHLAKAQAEREEEGQRQKEARLEVEQFILDHADEVVGYLGMSLGFHGWEDLLSRLKKAFDPEQGGNDYRPKAVIPTRRESELEKFVRVLEMSTDATVQIQPQEPLYRLL